MNAIQKTRIDRITDLHNEIGGYLKMTLDKAIEIGALLSEQKAEIKHGEWLPWVKEKLPFSERLTRDYMRFYERREELKTAKVADLTQARKFLAAPQDKRIGEDTIGEMKDRLSDFKAATVQALGTHCEQIEQFAEAYRNTEIEKAAHLSVPRFENDLQRATKIYIECETDISRLLVARDYIQRIARAFSELTLSAELKSGSAINEVVDDLKLFFPSLSASEIHNNLDNIIAELEKKMAGVVADN